MENTASEVWADSCAHLKEVLSGDVYERWIAVITARERTDDTLCLTAPNGFYQQWLEENYLPLIKTAVATVCGKNLTISFDVEQNRRLQPEPAPAPTVTSQKKKSSRSSTSKRMAPKNSNNLILNPNYTFESFIVGPSNNFPHAASLAVAQSPAKAYNPLFIYGGVGLGKTHLMQAIGHAILSKNSRSKIRYITSEIFLNEYIDALKKSSLVDFRKRYRGTDVLLIDDIQFLAGKDRMQEEFFHTFNVLFDAHKQIVITCDRPASEIPGLEQRLVSRFEWGLVTDLEVPDVETSIAILRKKQEMLNIQLPNEMLIYMAERIRSNVRRLEGALIRAASYTSLTGYPLTIESLHKLLRGTFEQEKKESISVDKIQRIVAEHYSIQLGDLSRKGRSKQIAFPRQVAMYLSRTLTEQSSPIIGEAFGRDHATVLYSCRKITEQLAKDSSLRETISTLNGKLAK